MLLEKLFYPEDFPIRITIANLVEDPIHYHTDIEFVYVLKGEIQLKNGYYTYHLRAGDIFTNSGNEVHSMKAVSQDNMIAQVQVSTRDLSQYFPNLSKACYRTYSKKPTDKKHERLRELLLQLLLKYELKGLNYKSQCLYLMVDIIKHLDRYFNLFAFDKDMVVGFDRGNPLAVERISRICQYVYQNYANNITLQDLSDMEHLSSFYISHLIKDFTEMNFRELLCFARVEMSEVKLLGSSKKISQIAREVGFSTTTYYEKYFNKWFGLKPQEYRSLYQPQIKNDLNPGVFHELSPSRAISLVREAYTNQNSQQGIDSVVATLNFDVEVDPDAKALTLFGKDLQMIVSPADYHAMGPNLFELLRGIAPSKVLLPKESEDQPEVDELYALLTAGGFSVEIKREQPRIDDGRFACDSVIFPVYLIAQMVEGKRLLSEIYLRDSADGADADILQGQTSPITTGGGKKPSYYAYAALSRIRGDIIARGGQYCVVRTVKEDGRPTFIVFVYNGSDSLYSVCQNKADLLEVRHMINDFRDELNLGFSLNLKPGTYSVIKYSLNKENNIFAHLSALDFRRDAISSLAGATMLEDAPTVETYLENVRTVLNLNFSLKGLGIQVTVIHPCDG